MPHILSTDDLGCALGFAPLVPLSIEERQRIFKSHEVLRSELELFKDAYRELLARWAKPKESDNGMDKVGARYIPNIGIRERLREAIESGGNEEGTYE